MPFSTLPFIFWFLPIVFLINLLIKKRLSNIFLGLASLFFYFWGESQYTYVFLVSIGLNYILGLLINKFQILSKDKLVKAVLIVGVIINLLLLGYFKYLNFGVDLLNHYFSFLQLKAIPNNAIHLPIGISFFTFEAIAYLADVYTKKASVMKNPVNLLLYMGIFPHLIAGPVIRYKDLEAQIQDRQIRIQDVSYGLKRFILGLGKKVIIANNVGSIADNIFGASTSGLGSNVLLLGIVAYSLQLFFDFSGYSDMAIGLGKMFGFTFIENFNYPYAARSVQEFWRRWNISLGLWFKNYVYIPMGGSKVGLLRNNFNLITVFFLTGLWHGAALNYIVWGLFNGFFIILEKLFLTKIFQKLPKLVSNLYLILVIMISWVFFRASDFHSAGKYLVGLLSNPSGDVTAYLNNYNLCALIVGIVLAFPFVRNCVERWQNSNHKPWLNIILQITNQLFLLSVFVISVILITSSNYNPFIYFRF